MGVDEKAIIDQYMQCDDHVPKSMQQHADLYVEFFDKENIDTAVRIGWCESRGKENAVRTAEGNYDSGVMQFVSWTWNWVHDKFPNEIPHWNKWIVMYNGRPYTENKVSKSSLGFTIQQAQKTAYYNIKASSYLAQHIYSKVRWTDWNSSKWCWGNKAKWNKLWKAEESGKV